MILTLSVLFPGITETKNVGLLIGGSILAVIAAIGVRLFETAIAPATLHSVVPTEQRERERSTWRMPPLRELPPGRLKTLNRASG